MKNNKENSLRWQRQAEYDLNQGIKLLADGNFSYASFFAEQAAQKILKAFLIFKGRRFITIHSVGELLKEAAALDNKFSPLINKGKKLDRHYLISRYPDALPEPAIPAESYTKDEAEEAVEIAKQIFEITKNLIS